MKKISLNGAWQMRPLNGNVFIEGAVPGSVYADLLRHGLMEDPFYRDNENAALSLMDGDYIYRRAFTLAPEDLDADSLTLRANGLDTLATITVNGVSFERCENMHRVYEFELLDIVRAGENEISILFESPTRYIKQKDAEIRADGSSDCTVGFPHLRKAHCMFGWDWGPRLPDMGVWRDIEILKIDRARIADVMVRQQHNPDGSVVLQVDTEIESFTGLCACEELSFEARVCVLSPGGERMECDDGMLRIEKPALWWPRGYGEQPLYTVAVALLAEDRVLDERVLRVGLRTLTMRREKDEWGESFATEVNGVQIFAMGADYIPEDNILSRVNEGRTRRLLEDAALANFNAVRVWGGGYYPDDWFFDICDELGLVVWEDFMFACAVYELTPEFAENIRQELIDNIKRLRHHACLALWCGNNEMEMFVDMGMWVGSKKQKADYIRMYEYLFPEVLREYDPDTFYWPASPSSGGGFDEPNDPDRGDVHYWDVWHGNKPFTEYRKFFFRYASEFGFQSFPSVKTIEAFTLPEDRNVFSYVMEKHQRNDAANGKIMNYMAQNYLYPGSFEMLIYASQLLQADAIRYGVEHWRRNRGRCMGAIYWQLNDCWPVASWSSIDYFGRWKALHYAAKRFFAKVLISCHEEGILSQNTNVNAEPYAVKKSARLNVSNETMSSVYATVHWALRDANGDAVESGEESLTVDKLSAVWLRELAFPEADLYSNYFSYSLYIGGERASMGTSLFCPAKHFKFKNPRLAIERNGDELTVRADAFAKSVEIVCDDGDVLLSDNFFDMNAGSRTVTIVRGNGASFRARSVYDIR